VREAEANVLEAHAKRLSKAAGKAIDVSDVLAGRAPRPRLLDMFAGGGAIPLEASRLGCEAHAIDLNPVAFIIELCTLVFPQQYGSSLADEVENWAQVIVERTKVLVNDTIPSLNLPPIEPAAQPLAAGLDTSSASNPTVIAYYWTRTVPCPNPQCRGTVPLYSQTWLRRRPGRYVALRPLADVEHRVVRFEVVEALSEDGIGFDPSIGSEGSSTTCPFCPATLSGTYVRKYGNEKGFGQQLMCVICQNPSGSGKLYLTGDALVENEEHIQALCAVRAAAIETELGSSSFDELIPPTGNAGLLTGKSYLYGIRTFRQAFTARQRLVLLTLAREIRRAYAEIEASGIDPGRGRAICTYLGLWLSRLTDRCNALSRWDNSRENIQGLTSLKRFKMAWDFPEVNLFGGSSGDALGSLSYVTAVIRQESAYHNPTQVTRGSATELSYPDEFFDAIITDPPYYDNESYSELSDICYVWLRSAIGFLYSDSFASKLTPKKRECVAAAYRQGGKESARHEYEACIFKALLEARRVMKPDAILVTIYAHKTTLGWSTLVEALRRAGFVVTEAWPLDTEAKSRVAHRGDAALASSIFLVARKRLDQTVGSFEHDVQPELGRIVEERVQSLWAQGIGGADLVIACVGAGLRAFTRHGKVELANGDDVPAERFLAAVEASVLESILHQLSKEVMHNGEGTLEGLDPATRFYILWRYTYKNSDVEAGEAIIFANGTHVELDGANGLSHGPRALVVKKSEKDQIKYRLRDFARGSDERLGLSQEAGGTPLAIDVLHRILWLMENRPGDVSAFLDQSRANREQLRLVAQALAGPALRGGDATEAVPSGEQASLAKLIANWKSVIDDAVRPQVTVAQPSLFPRSQS
jgi:putative DNA methylase